VKWAASNLIQDAGIVCGGSSGGSGSPAGSNSSLQFNNAGAFGGSAFLYTTPGSVPTLTGPDGSVWNSGGFTAGASSPINLGSSGLLVANSIQVGVADPPCSSATFIWGSTGTNYCSHATSTDNAALGEDVFENITSGFGNVAAGSETLKGLTSGNYNTCLGFESCHGTTVTGSQLTAVGQGALGGVSTDTGSVGVGVGALASEAGGANNTAVGPGVAPLVTTGSQGIFIGNDAGPLVTTGNKNIMIGASTGYGIAAGHGNVAIGGQFSTLSDQNDSITLADGDGNILAQYLTGNGYLSIKQPVRSMGNFIGASATTVSGLASTDSSPIAGDRGFVTDATSCTFNSSVTGGGSTKCPVVYNGSAWVAG
jgi:hypothetical protein